MPVTVPLKRIQPQFDPSLGNANSVLKFILLANAFTSRTSIPSKLQQEGRRGMMEAEQITKTRWHKETKRTKW
jgi:hypothetical protein